MGRLPFMCFIITSGTCSYVPQPPRQTEYQRTFFAEKDAAAKVASQSRDTQMRLTALLDSSTFRNQLQTLAPSLSRISTSVLVSRFREELVIAEVAHGFHARDNPLQNNALDLDIDIALNATWFYNQWQLPLLFPDREQRARHEFIAFMAPAAAFESEDLGMKSFSGNNPYGNIWPGGYPANLPEASDRLVYNVINLHKLDFPNYLWGDVSFVFNNTAVNDLVLLVPMDSGDHTCDCDTNFTMSFCGNWDDKIPSVCEGFWYCRWLAL